VTAPWIAFPIPAPPGTPWWVNILFGLAAIATVVVVVVLAVRGWPRDGDDDSK
jgi:hypothetical protein